MMSTWKTAFRMLCLLCCMPAMNFGSSLAATEVVTIYVAPKNTPAYEFAAEHSAVNNGFHSKLSKALEVAAEIVNQPGERTVQVLVASGDYTGKQRQGTWEIPQLNNEGSSLVILGGFDDQFKTRDPFRQPVNLVTTMNRTGPLITVEKRSKTHMLVISGFVFDASPSNSYDPKNGSLLRSSSRTYPLMSFSNILLKHLVVADNVFINGAHGAFDPLISPGASDTRIDISNNFFINNVKPIKVGAGLGFRGNKVSAINVEHNTFLFNWPFNPDVTSSNVGAIQLNTSESAASLNFSNNLFAYNVSGVFQQDWEPSRMPHIGIKDNLFFRNADLFGMTEPQSGVMVGKFGLNPKYVHFDLDAVEEELEYELAGNQAFNPGIVEDHLVCDRQQKLADENSAPLENASADFLAELEAEDWSDEDVEFSYDKPRTDDQNIKDVHLGAFAPMMKWDNRNLALPMNENGKNFGVQVDSVWNSNKEQ